MRTRPVRSKAQVSAGLALARRAAASSKMTRLQDAVASAAAKVAGDSEAVEWADTHESDATARRVQDRLAAQLKEFHSAQQRLDETSGLSMFTVDGQFSRAEAIATCELNSATLCSHAEMVQAFLQGHHSCSCGWTSTSLDEGGSYIIEYSAQPLLGKSCGGSPGDQSYGLLLCGEIEADSEEHGGGYAANCCSRGK
eukprot:g3039.t1